MTDAIFDANSAFARAFFAVTGPNPEASVEEALEAAVQSMLFTLGNLGEPADRALFCFDGKAKKDKGRGPKPANFETCLHRFKDLIPTITGTEPVLLAGFEADDVVATATYTSTADRIYVVSGDKDLHQLQSDNTSIYDLNTKGVLSRHAILKRWMVKRPSQSAIALAILGDPRDNIQGLKGWGKKKVETLFERVTPEMAFEEALNTIESQIPERLRPSFYESLALTLLNVSIEGVPAPSPIKLCEMDALYELGFGSLEPTWNRLAGAEGRERLSSRREGSASSLIDRLGL